MTKLYNKIKQFLKDRAKKKKEKEHYFTQLARYLDSIGQPSWITGARYERLSLQVGPDKRVTKGKKYSGTLVSLKEKR